MCETPHPMLAGPGGPLLGGLEQFLDVLKSAFYTIVVVSVLNVFNGETRSAALQVEVIEDAGRVVHVKPGEVEKKKKHYNRCRPKPGRHPTTPG
jgi:hypothetical protein